MNKAITKGKIPIKIIEYKDLMIELYSEDQTDVKKTAELYSSLGMKGLKNGNKIQVYDPEERNMIMKISLSSIQ